MLIVISDVLLEAVIRLETGERKIYSLGFYFSVGTYGLQLGIEGPNLDLEDLGLDLERPHYYNEGPSNGLGRRSYDFEGQ